MPAEAPPADWSELEHHYGISHRFDVGVAALAAADSAAWILSGNLVSVHNKTEPSLSTLGFRRPRPWRPSVAVQRSWKCTPMWQGSLGAFGCGGPWNPPGSDCL